MTLISLETALKSPVSIPIPANETGRLAALHSYNILDTAEEKDFDDLTELASLICQTPVALVTLLDGTRQWFKSHRGTNVTETPKEFSFCAHAIASPEPIMIVSNARNDERFAENPLVTGEPYVAFYAGVPLVNKDGFALGSLCVVDTEVKELTNQQISALKVLGKQVMDKLELRRKISELEMLNNYLNESEHRFRGLISQAPVAIATYSVPDLIIEQANEQMLSIVGRGPEIIGQPLIKARPELQGHRYMDVLQNVIDTGKTHTGGSIKAPVLVNGEVTERYFDITYKPVKDQVSKITSIMVVAADVTDKALGHLREMELSEEMAAINEELTASNEELNLSQQYLIRSNIDLIKSESRFRGLIEQSPVAIAALKGRHLLIDMANDQILKIWGKEEQVIGQLLHKALPELEGQPFLQLLDDVYTSGEAYCGNEAKVTIEYGGELKDRFINFVYHPVKDETGTTDILVVATDVTEQVDARLAVEEFNQRLQIALDAGELGSYDVDLNTGIMYCTEQCKKNFGRAADAVFNFNDLFEAILPEYRDYVKQEIDKGITNNILYHAEYQVKWPDGSIHWISAHGKPRYHTDGSPERMVGVTSDITKQVNARKELEAAEEKFRLITDNISQLAWMADETGAIFWYNQRWFDFTGTILEEMYGWGWQKIHHPDYVEKVADKFKHHLLSGEVWEDTFPLKGADGEYRWFLSRAIPSKNTDGQIISWFGTNTDITEQRSLEQRKDDFLSIASHELKTPITSLKGSLQLLNLIKDKPASPMHVRLIEQANRSMERMSVLVDELLNINRLSQGQLQLNKTTFTIAQMLNSCCSHIRIAGKYELILQGDETLHIHADEHRIDQVVVNLVNNAIKYAPDSKEVYLSAQKNGSFAKISVTDKGPGIAADKIPLLFDRYYRGDHSGKSYSGLGLGLFISSEIVKRHGGEIGVDSIVGTGSTFWFTLPI